MADTINARFRALRKRLDLTIAQMADVLGLSPSGISAIECAQRNVTDKHIRLLASAYPRLNVEWLKSGEGDIFLPEIDHTGSIDDLCAQYGLDSMAASMLRSYVQLDAEHRQMIHDWLMAWHDDYDRRKARTSGGDGQTADDAAPSSADADPDADFKRQVLEGRARHEAYMAAQRDAESKQAQ